jgi:hypothetical protein
MQLGTPLALPFQIASADFDPAGKFAVVVSTETPAHAYVVQNASNPTVTDLGPVADHSTVLAVNSTGQTAALSAPGQLQFLTGLNGTPSLADAIPTQPLLGPISAALIDDAGQCAILGTSNSGTGALETLCSDGSTQRLLAQPGMLISAIALANQGQDAILADSAGQQVLRLASYAQSGTPVTLATAKDGINAPVGLQVTAQQLLVADSSANAIFVIDLSGKSALQSIPLGSAPARLKLLSDQSVALLTDPASAMFTIFDLQAMQPFFIPTN